MKLLVRESVDSLASEDAFDRVYSAYQSHLEEHRDQMSAAIQQLAFDTNFHDTLFSDIRRDGDTVETHGLLGDLQVGYQFFKLTYSVAELTLSQPLKETMALQGAEVLIDEITRSDNRWCHAFLLWPEGELEISFSEVTVLMRPATPSDRNVFKGTRFSGL